MSDLDRYGTDVYAGFWRRLGGFLLDWLLFFVVSFVVGFVFGLGFGMAGGEPGDGALFDPTAAGNLASLVTFFAWFLYDTILTSRFGWTLGKRAVGIEVRGADGELISWARAVGRFFARFLSYIVLLLGFLWAAWDPRKQTWHDKLTSVYVVEAGRVGGTASPAATAGTAPAWGGWGIPQQQATWGQQPPQQQAGPAQPAQQSGGWGQPATGAPGGGWSAPGSPSPGGVPAGEQDPSGDAPGSPAVAAGDDPDWAADLDWDRPARPPTSQEPEEPAAQAVAGWAAATERPAEARPDPNAVAIQRADVSHETAGWLQQVASQVDARLDRVSPTWRGAEAAEAARACAFGILLGHLATTYPHMEADLGRVAEAHPSFSTLLEGSRLATLQQIAGDLGRATAWLGPLVGAEDREQIRRLLD